MYTIDDLLREFLGTQTPSGHTRGVPFREAHHEQLILELAQWAQRLGFIRDYSLNDNTLPEGVFGRYGEMTGYGNDGILRINGRYPSEDRLRVTFHELGHALGFNNSVARKLGSTPDSAYAALEVAAESIAQRCMKDIGYDTSRFSDPYIDGWGQDAHPATLSDPAYWAMVERIRSQLVTAACDIRGKANRAVAA